MQEMLKFVHPRYFVSRNHVVEGASIDGDKHCHYDGSHFAPGVLEGLMTKMFTS